MRDINKFLILASVLLAACTTDPLQESPDATGGPEATTAVKICNTSDDAVRGTLIAKAMRPFRPSNRRLPNMP